jgi:hypothetical protein
MTLEDLKRMDRLIRQVRDPFGSGYQSWMKILKEYAEKNDTSVTNVALQHFAWRIKN